jgi:hypothetical protein
MCAGSACGPYGHDIHLAEICAAWNSPPIKEMTREEYEVGWAWWSRVQGEDLPEKSSRFGREGEQLEKKKNRSRI